SRLQVWAHPPEEYLPFLQKRLDRGELYWEIRFQIDPPYKKPLKLPIVQIAPSLEPNNHRPIVIGPMPNPQRRHLVGQPVTVTIFVDPDPDTVEIPTDALNEVEGESLVFVQSADRKNEFTLRRVSVSQRFKDVTLVRSRLSARDEKISAGDV